MRTGGLAPQTALTSARNICGQAYLLSDCLWYVFGPNGGKACVPLLTFCQTLCSKVAVAHVSRKQLWLVDKSVRALILLVDVVRLRSIFSDVCKAV